MPIPRKRFGQHFLRDENVIAHIIDALSPQKNQHIIEIGPGLGALTLPLLKHLSILEAVEIDQDLIGQLQQRCQNEGELHIYTADALEFDFAQLKKDERLLRIVGNLPYNISTPLLFHLLTFMPLIQDMLFMLQKEVGTRLAAPPGNKDYGRLSVMVQYHCRVDRLFDVPASAFYPAPKVESSIIHLIPYRDYPHRANNMVLFTTLVKQAFNQRRKTLRNSLQHLITDETWATLPISAQARPETLSVADFVTLSNALPRMSS